jgi:Spy/CpxP family protein refolding chaperone
MTAPTVQQKATLWLAIVFVLGAALGGVLGYAFAHRTYASAPPVMTAEAKRQERRERMTRDVGLNAEQQKQVKAILDQSQVEYKALHAVMDPQIEAVRQKTRDKIRALLTADQQPKFEEFLRKLDEERKRAAQ